MCVCGVHSFRAHILACKWGSQRTVIGEESRKLGTAGVSLQGDTTEGELGGERERGTHSQAGRLLMGSFEVAAGWGWGLTSCVSADLSPPPLPPQTLVPLPPLNTNPSQM